MALTNAEKQARHRERQKQRIVDLELENLRLSGELRRQKMLSVYAIRDGKAEAYSPPFIARSDGEAMRIVMQTLLGDSQLTQFPDDFTLFRIGEWFEDGGVLEGHSPQFVAHVSSLMPGGTLNPLQTDPVVDRILKEKLNGEADAVGDGASVQSGAERDDTEERF